MKPIDLFGTGIQSYSAIVTSQRRLNCFYDLRQDGEKSNVVVLGTPGTLRILTLPTYPVRGWHVAGVNLYVVAGAAVFKVTSALAVTNLGTLNTTSGKVSMVDDGVNVSIVDGVKGYTVNMSTDAFATISDGNFPNGATTIAFFNGRSIVEKPNSRQFYISQSYAAGTWTPVIFGTKENKSDALLAVSAFNGLVIMWGAASIEFWQADASTSLTISRISGATQSWGLAAVFSRLEVNNSMIFLGVRPEGGYQVARFNGYTPEPISTSDLDSIINSFTTVSDAVALSYTTYGHPMYQLTFPTANRSFLYDTKAQVWSEVQTGLDMQTRHYAELSVNFNGATYASDYSSGVLYKFDQNTYTDNGQPIKRQVRTKHVHNNGNRFSVTDLFLDMEVGDGLQTGQGSNPQLMVRTSKDGGRTFGYERLVGLGAVGQYLTRVILRRFGRAKDFVFEFTMTDPIPFVLVKGSAKISDMEGQDG